MTKSTSNTIKPPVQTPLSSRSIDFKKGDLLPINNIQGRRLCNVFTVNVRNVDTLGQLKKTISSRNGLSVVAVYYRGIFLEDGRKLAHLLPGMLKMGSPRFAVRTRLYTEPQPGGISLFVKGLEGLTFQVHLHARSTVADLRSAIRDYEGYCTEQGFQIVCAGKMLLAEDMALTECNLVSGSLVDVVGNLLGGDAMNLASSSSQTFVDMEKMSSLKTTKVYPIVPGSDHEKSTPIWKRLQRGLTVQGKCANATCEAYRKMVNCKKGLTVFNIAEDVQCPMCQVNFKAITCGFNECQWMFEGRKTGITSVDVMSKWNVTIKGEYQWFDEYRGRNTAQWSNLIITTKELPRDDSSVTSDGGRGNIVRPDSSKCALCFGTITARTSASANTQNIAPCGHAVHSECAMELRREGYTACPTCRDPMEAMLQVNSNVSS